MDKSINEGVFSRKQIGSRSRIIAWSHSSRFKIGLECVAGRGIRNLLDYGCGDGTFLKFLSELPGRPASMCGGEVAVDMITSNRLRFASIPQLTFTSTADLQKPEFNGTFDALVCMEVLEHVVDLDWFVREFERLLAPGGLLLISVPVEIGLSVVIKQAIRQINGWRGIDHYPGTTPYTWLELFKAVLAGRTQHVTRPVHRGTDGSPVHDHKGFNWKLLREKLGSRFAFETVRTSPVPWLPPFVASQVWLIGRRRG